MTTTNYHQNLNLKEGASISEIKAAFRYLAKAHHPDAEGRTPEDVDKFIKAQTAYQKLLKKAVDYNKTNRSQQAAANTTFQKEASNWRLESICEAGLDIHYRLQVLRPASGEVKLVLPWKVREACPRCLGQGQTLGQIGQNSLYRPHTCPKCAGKGSISRSTQLETTVSENMVGQTKIRLKKAGLYNSQEARRGDLIMDITWVDHLTRTN